MTTSWRNATTSSAARGYGYRWQKARAQFLAENPLCTICDKTGRTVLAQVVDHIKPHRGDDALFWDRANWQPLCKQCHSSDKQRAERSGRKATKFNADARVIW